MPVTWFSGTINDFASQLAHDIATANAVFLVGAGVSSVKPSRLPLGKELRDTVIRLVSRKSKLRRRYRQLQANPKYENLLPEVAFSDLFTVLQGKLLPAFEVLRKSAPNLIHMTVGYFSRRYGLPVFTTNFDALLEAAKADCDLVYHLHGSLDQPETMSILLRHVHQRSRPHYHQEFLEHTKSRRLYVFGYSGADPDIRRLIADAECADVCWLIRPEPSRFTYLNVNLLARSVTAFEGDLESLFTGLGSKFVDFTPSVPDAALVSRLVIDVRHFGAAVSTCERYLALALLFYRIHEFKTSLRLCREALRENVAASRKEQLQLLIFLAEVSNVIGEPKESTLKLLEAEAVQRADSIYYGQLLNTIGLLYLREDAFAEALEYFLRARDVCRRRIASRDQDEVPLARVVLSQTENNIGLCYFGEGELSLAKNCFLRSLRQKRRIGHLLGEVASLQNLALVALRGRHNKSFYYWERAALKAAERYSLWRRMVEHLRDTADIFITQGDHREAKTRIDRAISICKLQISGMGRELNEMQERLKRLMS